MGEEGMRRRDFLRAGAGVAAGAFVAGCGVGPQSAPPAVVQPVVKPKIDGDLLIFNWTEYMNPKVIKRFEKQYGVKVTVSNFDSMPSMMAKLQAGNQYDLIFPTADYVNRLNRRNALRPLDRAALKNAAASTRSSTTPGTTRTPRHTVPYGMYTTGIAWREDKVGDLTGSWGDLANEQAKGRIFMLDDFQEAIGQANLLQRVRAQHDGARGARADQGDAAAREGVPARLLDQPGAEPGQRHGLDPSRLERGRRQRAQPVQEPGEPALPDLQGGDPGRLGLHGDPVQRAPPGHGDAVHRLDARPRERGRERVVVRLPDADQGHRGRVRRAGLERPERSRSRRTTSPTARSSASSTRTARRRGTASGRR